LEFKIRGTLDEGQLNAHKRLLTREPEVLRLDWDVIMSGLKNVKTDDEVLSYLIQNFIRLKSNFKSKRRSSGMPHPECLKKLLEIKLKEMSYILFITGSRKVKQYKIEQVYLKERKILSLNMDGIQNVRRFIARYVNENHEILPIQFLHEKTVVTDYCVAPGRAEHKNS
jgi:hypothetical protein